jgi:putative membrane protein
MGSDAWFGGFHFPFGLLPLALLGFAAFWLISRNRTPVRQENASPLEVLKRRYASGEIDRDEYLRQSADINA